MATNAVVGHAYEQKLNMGAAAGDLPDIVDMDGPYAANYAYSNILRSLDDLIDKESDWFKDYVSATIEQGTFDGKLYALGAMESSVGIYFNKKMLPQYGIEPPTFSIVVPSLTPVFATAAILNFTTNWNSFLWPLIAVTDQKYYTIQLGIESFFTAPSVYFGQIMAALTLASLPMLVVFISLQRYFVEGFAGMGK